MFYSYLHYTIRTLIVQVKPPNSRLKSRVCGGNSSIIRASPSLRTICVQFDISSGQKVHNFLSFSKALAVMAMIYILTETLIRILIFVMSLQKSHRMVHVVSCDRGHIPAFHLYNPLTFYYPNFS